MRAGDSGTGLSIRLVGLEDKEILDSKKSLECKMYDSERIVRINIQDVVERTDPFAEKGFDLRYIPKGTHSDTCKIINIILSSEVYAKLIKEEYFVSRTMMDRIDMI